MFGLKALILTFFAVFSRTNIVTAANNVRINTRLLGVKQPDTTFQGYNQNGERLFYPRMTDASLQQLVSSVNEVRDDISSVCLNHTEMIIDGIVKREPWALRSK